MCQSCKSGGPPVAAVWWRVSTDPQGESSPDTQRAEALALAAQDGYQVPEEYILGTVWHSLSVWDSPAMDRLKGLIRSQSIHAVFMYHSDRGASKPAHRLLFRALCEEYGVQVRCKYGQPLEGDTGEVMEFLEAWAKEKQVKRAQQGAKDGLHSRPKDKGLPVNGQAPYGYRLRYHLEGEGASVKKVPVAYEPDGESYFIASRVLRMALEGLPIRAICRALVSERVPAPRGGTHWGPATVLRMMKNPLYAGRCYTLKTERVKGQRSRQAAPLEDGNKHRERNSERKRPASEWIELPAFPVEAPILTWEQYLALQVRLEHNKKVSRRNASRPYLLAGLLFCDECGGKLHPDGRKSRPDYRYVCQNRYKKSIGIPSCPTLPLKGAETDAQVWASIVALMDDPRKFSAEMNRRKGDNTSGADEVRASIKTLETKRQKVYEQETKLALMNVRGDLSDEAFHRSTAMMKAEMAHYEEEIGRQQAALAALSRQEEALDALSRIAETMRGKLQSAKQEDQIWVLHSIKTRVDVDRTGIKEISVGCGDSVAPGIYVPDTEVA